jgi:Glycosyltransferase family 87
LRDLTGFLLNPSRLLLSGWKSLVHTNICQQVPAFRIFLPVPLTTPISRSPLTARRIRAHGILLGVVIWTIYLWTLATPTLRDRNGLLKGTDFLHFYTLGTLALEHRGADLYNLPVQSAVAAERVPEAGYLLYVPLYGPQVSLLFAPLAKLSYGVALSVWLIFNALIYAICCYAIWRTCPHLQSARGTVFVLAMAYPAFIHLLAWGQTSGLALACFTAAYMALRSQKMFLAGVAIGCLIFKPQLGIAAGVVFLMTLEWKVIVGAVAAASAQLAAGWIYYGTTMMLNYIQHLLHVRQILPLLEPRPYQMHSLRSFWAMLVPWGNVAFALYAVSALAVLWMTVRYWKTTAPLSLRFSVVLIATVLVAPHLTVYDLVILAPAFLLISDWSIANWQDFGMHAIGLLLYLCYVLALIGPLSRWTHFQISIPALFALLWLVSRRSLSENAAPSV